MLNFVIKTQNLNEVAFLVRRRNFNVHFSTDLLGTIFYKMLLFFLLFLKVNVFPCHNLNTEECFLIWIYFEKLSSNVGQCLVN